MNNEKRQFVTIKTRKNLNNMTPSQRYIEERWPEVNNNVNPDFYGKPEPGENIYKIISEISESNNEISVPINYLYELHFSATFHRIPRYSYSHDELLEFIKPICEYNNVKYFVDNGPRSQSIIFMSEITYHLKKVSQELSHNINLYRKTLMEYEKFKQNIWFKIEIFCVWFFQIIFGIYLIYAFFNI